MILVKLENITSTIGFIIDSLLVNLIYSSLTFYILYKVSVTTSSVDVVDDFEPTDDVSNCMHSLVYDSKPWLIFCLDMSYVSILVLSLRMI